VIRPLEAEQPAQFAFRLVEASGENIWYIGIVEAPVVETIGAEIVAAANDLQPDCAVLQTIDSALVFENAVRAAASRIWIAQGFERFDPNAWSTLDRCRTRLERSQKQNIDVDSTVVVLIMSAQTYGILQTNAPNLASWIGGSVFSIAPEAALSPHAREARLDELRNWSSLSDEEVIRRALEGSLPAEPYFAEWLVLLDRGDLLGDE
jgi:hypothetical protein